MNTCTRCGTTVTIVDGAPEDEAGYRTCTDYVAHDGHGTCAPMHTIDQDEQNDEDNEFMVHHDDATPCCSMCAYWERQEMGEEMDAVYSAEQNGAAAIVYRTFDGLGTMVGIYRTLDEAQRVAAYLNDGHAPVTTTPASLWVAEYESRHFSFQAVGFSEQEARQALLRGLQRHGAQTGLDADWFAWGYSSVDEFLSEVNVDEVPVGGCLRDHSAI